MRKINSKISGIPNLVQQITEQNMELGKSRAQDDHTGPSSSTAGLIAGTIIGAALLMGLVAVIAVVIVKKRRRSAPAAAAAAGAAAAGSKPASMAGAAPATTSTGVSRVAPASAEPAQLQVPDAAAEGGDEAAAAHHQPAPLRAQAALQQQPPK